MTYWRCIKCSHTHPGSVGQVAFRCSCGQWCVDITEITTEIKQKGDLTAIEVNNYGDRLIERCLGV